MSRRLEQIVNRISVLRGKYFCNLVIKRNLDGAYIMSLPTHMQSRCAGGTTMLHPPYLAHQIKQENPNLIVFSCKTTTYLLLIISTTNLEFCKLQIS